MTSVISMINNPLAAYTSYCIRRLKKKTSLKSDLFSRKKTILYIYITVLCKHLSVL